MRLNLFYDDKDQGVLVNLGFFDHRRYAVRTMVPPGYEPYFQEQARYISAHTSTAIEGNPLGHETAMLVLAGEADVRSSAGIEKVNLDQAYEFIALLASDRSTRIDEGLIRTMNSIVLKGLPDPQARNRGKYRVGQNLVVDSDTREIRYRPPPPEWVPELMGHLATEIARWMDQHPAPIAAALAHFGLISIHPFDEGNGRTARLLADMVLDLKGWSVEGMLAVSKVMLDRRSEYYASLREAQGEVFNESVDVTPFVRFHTDALAMAAARLEDRVVTFNKRRDALIKQIDSLNPRQVTGLMFMIDIGPLSTSVYARLTRSSQATALADLSQLLSLELVTRAGAGRNTRYVLHPEVARMSEDGNEGGETSEQ
jgi:Fic family protein